MTNILGLPVGIDYDPHSTNLIVSVERGAYGSDFIRLGTNITQAGTNSTTNLTLAPWSGISGLADEVYLAVVRANSAGFTNGDMFFGSDTGIGWLSNDGTRSNLNWCVLTNGVVTNALLLRGGLCMDTTGLFGSNIVAVTSSEDGLASYKGVWEVDSRAHPTLLASIYASLLEGSATTTNDVQKWGPWAGTFITGDEFTGLIYTIGTNGIVSTNDSRELFPGGFLVESIQIIPPNQSLYLCDPGGLIVKLPANYFTNYAGDLLIEDGGENLNGPAKLFIVQWDAASTNFLTRRIIYNYGSGTLEHCAFAPIELPAQ